MTDDDAELRARIEAQVAARRADPSSKGERSLPDELDPEPEANPRARRGPQGLAPTRRWGKTRADSESPPTPEAPEPPPSTDARVGRRRGVNPARPWAGRTELEPAEPVRPQPAAETEAEDGGAPSSARTARGRMRPARPWSGRGTPPEATPAAAEEEKPAIAPSNPDVVLRGLAAEEVARSEGDSQIGLVGADAPRRFRLNWRDRERAEARQRDDVRREQERADTEREAAAQLVDRRRREAERLESERVAAEQLIEERRREAERLEAERVAAAELVERRRRETERLAARRAEAERLEQLRADAERAEAEQRAAERAEARRLEAEQLAAERAEAEQRIAAERAEVERLRAEAERLATERADAEWARAEARRARERAEAERRRREAEPEAAPAESERPAAHQVPLTPERRRRFGRRPVEPERIGGESNLPDEEATTAFAAAADRIKDPSVDEAPAVDAPAAQTAAEAEPAAEREPTKAGPAYPWVAKDEVDLDLHGAQTWDPAMYPPEDQTDVPHRTRKALRWLLARAPEEPAAAEPPLARATKPEPAQTAEPKLAARPKPAPREAVEPEPAAAVVPEPVIEPTPEPAMVAPVAVSDAEAGAEETFEYDLAEQLPEEPPVAAAPAAAEATEPAEVGDALAEPAAPAEERQPRESMLGRLFGRRRTEGAEPVEEEEPEPFTLPEPDAAFEKPWLRSKPGPRPTRGWVRPALEAETTPEPAAQTPEPVVELPEPVAAAPEPVAAAPEAVAKQAEPVGVEPEPVAAAPEPVAKQAEPVAGQPEPVPSARPKPPAAPHRPTPGAVPAPLASRPGPGSGASSRRPTPGARPAAARRPSPGAQAANAGSHRPQPFELAAARPTPSAFADRPTAAGTAPRPNLARVLDKPVRTAEDAPDEDAPDEDAPDEDNDRGNDGSGGWRRFLIRSFIIIVIAGVAAILLRTFIVQPYYIPSASMEPTLIGGGGQSDDHVLVDKISYRAHGPRARDIVVFDRPKGANVQDKVLIKRVIALGGDTIAMRAGTVLVNGQRISEPYLNNDHSCYPTSNFATRKVPTGKVWVMGDNRCNSTDSRVFGAISTDLIIGRAFMIIWPLGRIGFLH